MPWVQLGKYVCLFLSVNGPNPEGDALFPSFSSFFDMHAFLVNRRKAQLRCATMRQLTNAPNFARQFQNRFRLAAHADRVGVAFKAYPPGAARAAFWDYPARIALRWQRHRHGPTVLREPIQRRAPLMDDCRCALCRGNPCVRNIMILLPQ